MNATAVQGALPYKEERFRFLRTVDDLDVRVELEVDDAVRAKVRLGCVLPKVVEESVGHEQRATPPPAPWRRPNSSRGDPERETEAIGSNRGGGRCRDQPRVLRHRLDGSSSQIKQEVRTKTRNIEILAVTGRWLPSTKTCLVNDREGECTHKVYTR